MRYVAVVAGVVDIVVNIRRRDLRDPYLRVQTDMSRRIHVNSFIDFICYEHASLLFISCFCTPNVYYSFFVTLRDTYLYNISSMNNSSRRLKLAMKQ